MTIASRLRFMRETPDEWDDYNESEDAPGPASATPVTLTVPADHRLPIERKAEA